MKKARLCTMLSYTKGGKNNENIKEYSVSPMPLQYQHSEHNESLYQKTPSLTNESNETLYEGTL